ncbi:MAG: hypothetical protein LBD55_00430 [Treponema sp.]|nr:hypothetical protein [Treponema sp.]
MYFRAYLRRRTGPEQLLAEFREEVYKLIAEIDAATDKDALLVEERIKTLRSILEDVDKRIGVHIREMDRRRFQEEAYAELGRKRSIIGSFPATVPQKTLKAFDLFSGSPQKPIQEALAVSEKTPGVEGNVASALDTPRTTEDNMRVGPRIVVSQRQIEPKPLPLAEQVAELSKAGLSPDLIARRLGVSISEVEVAIAISEGSGTEI